MRIVRIAAVDQIAGPADRTGLADCTGLADRTGLAGRTDLGHLRMQTVQVVDRMVGHRSRKFDQVGVQMADRRFGVWTQRAVVPMEHHTVMNNAGERDRQAVCRA